LVRLRGLGYADSVGTGIDPFSPQSVC